MNVSINNKNGVLEDEIKVSELIAYLQQHMDMYGDTAVNFMMSGEEDVKVQFDHFKDAITIDLYEDF